MRVVDVQAGDVWVVTPLPWQSLLAQVVAVTGPIDVLTVMPWMSALSERFEAVSAAS